MNAEGGGEEEELAGVDTVDVGATQKNWGYCRGCGGHYENARVVLHCV